MNDPDEGRAIRIQNLQARIDSALRESPEERASTNFSPYLPDRGVEIEDALVRAAAPGGIEGIEAALDEFDRLAPSVGRVQAQYALQLFLAHQPDVHRLGLRLPPLQERNPWKIRPSGDSN